MKKAMIFAAAAAMLLVACEKPENPATPEGPKEPVKVTVASEGTVEYAGVTYKTVTYTDGSTWMAENLRFVPEGMTISENPAEGGVWYPAEAGKQTALKGEEDIKKFGLLYDFYTALGIDETKVMQMVNELKETEIAEYLSTFEGKKGICPEGWHVPTVKELHNLVGCPISKEDEANTLAPCYDETYQKGKVSEANKQGFNFVFSGTVNKMFIGKPMYIKNVIGNPNDKDKPWVSPIEEWNGQNAVTGIMTSSYHKNLVKKDKVTEKVTAITGVLFYGSLSTFNSTYSEGSLGIMDLHIPSGYTVRCVKNN